MRFTDIMLSVPTLPLLLVVSRFVGGSVWSIVIILSVFGWMALARIVRGSTLSLRESEFVQAARVIGVGHGAIIWRHIIPNAMAPIIVYTTLGISASILAETSLSYLGLGIQPPEPSWGNMLSNAQQYMQGGPWLVFIPGFFIFISVMCFNFFGDGLRDALDPRMKIS
jgi:peptide/nickel transport system permease protein